MSQRHPDANLFTKHRKSLMLSVGWLVLASQSSPKSLPDFGLGFGVETTREPLPHCSLPFTEEASAAPPNAILQARPRDVDAGAEIPSQDRQIAPQRSPVVTARGGVVLARS